MFKLIKISELQKVMNMEKASKGNKVPNEKIDPKMMEYVAEVIGPNEMRLAEQSFFEAFYKNEETAKKSFYRILSRKFQKRFYSLSDAILDLALNNFNPRVIKEFIVNAKEDECDAEKNAAVIEHVIRELEDLRQDITTHHIQDIDEVVFRISNFINDLKH